MSPRLTPAQTRQQSNRDQGGRYAAKDHSESSVSLTPVVASPRSVASSVYSPHTHTRDLMSMADHAQPVSARLAVATSVHGGPGHLSATDPDVVVRAAATGRWDLSREDRSALERDPGVNQLLTTICA